MGRRQTIHAPPRKTSKWYLHRKRCSPLPISREMQIRTALRYHFSLPDWQKFKKYHGTFCWWALRQTHTAARCWWERRAVQPCGGSSAVANTTVCAVPLHPAVLLRKVTPRTYVLHDEHARPQACELQLVCHCKTLLEMTSMPQQRRGAA